MHDHQDNSAAIPSRASSSSNAASGATSGASGVDGRPAGWFTHQEGECYRAEAARFPGGTLVEVGVWLGRSLSFIAPQALELGQTLHAVDTWRGSPSDLTGTIARGADIYAAFLLNMRELGVEAVVRPLRMASSEAASLFANGSVDLVMIDGDHRYEAVSADLDAWLPKLRRGGAIMGHDFDPVNWPGVVRAVTERWPRVRRERRLWIHRPLKGDAP